MPKGKKFSAAEKHFEKKQAQYEKKVKDLMCLIDQQRITLSEQADKILALTDENRQLHDWVERLLEYTELSKEDMKAACEKDKRMGSLLMVADRLTRFF